MLARIRATVDGPDRGVLILIGALVILIVLLAFVAMKVGSIYEQIHHYYATSKAYADAQERFDIECRDIASPVELRDCFQRAIQSAREPQRTEEDLYAQKQMAHWTEWIVYITFGIGIMTIIVAGMSAYFLVEANKLNRDALIAEQRAWIRVDNMTVVGDFKWTSPTQASFIIQYRIANAGKSPARNIMRRSTATVGVDEIISTQRTLITAIRKKPMGRSSDIQGMHLFPDEDAIITDSVQVRLPECSFAWPEPLPDGRCISKLCCMFYIIGAIEYDLVFASDRKYTAYTYHFTKPGWSGPIRIEIGCERIPAKDLQLTRASYNGIVAT